MISFVGPEVSGLKVAAIAAGVHSDQRRISYPSLSYRMV